MDKLISTGTKIIGVGRNYVAHAKELGNPIPKEPVLFLKPTSSYLLNGGTILIPPSMEHLHYEAELAVVIGKKARDVPQSSAFDYVAGYAFGLDMTARELQSSIKVFQRALLQLALFLLHKSYEAVTLILLELAAGLPWLLAKGQDTFTPISTMIPKSEIPDPHNLELWLKVDGELRQKGSTKDMMFTVPFLISHISSFLTLLEGDVILTGTPEGVGPVKPGQKITGGITGVIDVSFDVAKRDMPISS
ncbi:hypothetical protein KSS87_005473 [Heliosperma pusillum]|nr:hypothetical protein KSS87_005473 [Heliosperma pusillum]